jgi:phosphotransferase system  glucose/maltose/N-acetylglucosamine-specific IIC component
MLRCMTFILAMLGWLVIAGLGMVAACPDHGQTAGKTTAGKVDATVHHAYGHGVQESVPTQRREDAVALAQPLAQSSARSAHVPGHGSCCAGVCLSHAACAGHCCHAAAVAMIAASPERKDKSLAIVIPSIAEMFGISESEMAALDRLLSRRMRDLHALRRLLPREHPLQRFQRLTI